MITGSLAAGARRRFPAAPIVVLLLAALSLSAAQTAYASTSGDEGASGSFDGGVSPRARCAKLIWQGYTWDIIGYNDAGRTAGVSGPAGTATLLLDKSSYSAGFKTTFDGGKPYSNQYSGSDLLERMNAFAASLGDRSAVVSRDLAGGSSRAVARDGYDGDSVRGDAPGPQDVWPLSAMEASQLKASARSYEDDWWLRTPGRNAGLAAYVSDNGSVNVYGSSVFDDREGVFLNYSMRPALYVSLSGIERIDPGMGAAIASGAADVGAYDPVVRVIDSKGHVWDVVGVNGRAGGGLRAPKGYAVLLLSGASKRKFSFSKQGKTIYGPFNESDSRTNHYADSALRKAMASAYNSIRKLPEFRGMILPRALRGQAREGSGDRDSVVAGPTVKSQGLWPLSVSEVRKLTNRQRMFADDWWVRSPGVAPYEGSDIYNTGYIPEYGSIVLNANALRPAFYLKLSSPIFGQLPDDWQSSV
jgi:hypothetical protein